MYSVYLTVLFGLLNTYHCPLQNLDFILTLEGLSDSIASPQTFLVWLRMHGHIGTSAVE